MFFSLQKNRPIDNQTSRIVPAALGIKVAMDPISWHDWETRGFRRFALNRRPALVFVTASWSAAARKMEDGVFSDPSVARIVNESFVPMIVDADRRPELFRRLSSGRVPAVVLLAPTGERLARGGAMASDEMVSFLQLARRRGVLRRSDMDGLSHRGTLAEQPQPFCASNRLPGHAINHFESLAKRSLDKEFGGFGTAPKFPNTPALRLLALRGFGGDGRARTAFTDTVRAMKDGEILGENGGFYRVARGPDWSAPVRQQLLADQADLALIYMDAWSLTGEADFASIAAGILDFVERDLGREDGGFLAFADGPGGGGDETMLSGAIARTCSALLKSEGAMGRPKRERALQTINFLFDKMSNADGLFTHYYVESARLGPELLGDQADILAMMIDAFEASGNTIFIKEASRLARAVEKHMLDKNTGAFLDYRPNLRARGFPLRPFRPIDENSRMAQELVRLSGITGDERYRETAQGALGSFGGCYRSFGLFGSDYAVALISLL